MVQIPTSIDGAIDALNGIEELLTAREWERAAIVYAFTREDGHGRVRGDVLNCWAHLLAIEAVTAEAVAHARPRGGCPGSHDVAAPKSEVRAGRALYNGE
jgi:hypothetical protein